MVEGLLRQNLVKVPLQRPLKIHFLLCFLSENSEQLLRGPIRYTLFFRFDRVNTPDQKTSLE